jgi:hypothetical protein
MYLDIYMYKNAYVYDKYINATPTASPTATPTASPTATPTASPTATPTASPTASPTAIPTAIPTSIPSVVPTSNPSVLPSATPTSVPSVKPTAIPTSNPSIIPTAIPTSIPSVGPTAIPTSNPSVIPTAIPTSISSASPSVNPYILTTIAGTKANGYGSYKDNINALSAIVSFRPSVAVDASSRIVIGETENHRVRMIVNGIITTVAGTGTKGYSGDKGPATLAMLNGPMGIAIGPTGYILICDAGNARIRMIVNGNITTIAGTGAYGSDGDKGPATAAQLGRPVNIAIDASGNFLFTDNWMGNVRMIDKNGIITTIAGSGTGRYSAYNGDGIATSRNIISPVGIAIDINTGDIFIIFGALYGTSGRIGKISVMTGMMSTVAGGGYFAPSTGNNGDSGPATSAQIRNDGGGGIAIDAQGNILFCDTDSVSYGRVRTVSRQTGVITTLIIDFFAQNIAIDRSGDIIVGGWNMIERIHYNK